MSSRARRLVAATASTLLLGLGVVACSSGGSDDSGGDDSGGSAAESSVAGAAPAPADAPLERDAGAVADSAESRTALQGFASDEMASGGGGAEAAPAMAPVEPAAARSLVKKGNVALRSRDVGDTLFDIGKVLQRTGGEIAENNTQADDQGETEQALLTVRVPVEQFETAFEDLQELGRAEDGVDLIDSSSTSTDVSTEVIDTDVRVELQRRSIDRISVLLDRASSIRDIVGIERELARREADLGSLQKRQAFLADQTSLSTLTISVERPAAKAQAEKQKKEEADDGFVGGLKNGWDAFKAVTSGLLTATGAILPFALLVLLVAVPVRIWLRRRPAPLAPQPEA